MYHDPEDGTLAVSRQFADKLPFYSHTDINLCSCQNISTRLMLYLPQKMQILVTYISIARFGTISTTSGLYHWIPLTETKRLIPHTALWSLAFSIYWSVQHGALQRYMILININSVYYYFNAFGRLFIYLLVTWLFANKQSFKVLIVLAVKSQHVNSKHDQNMEDV